MYYNYIKKGGQNLVQPQKMRDIIPFLLKSEGVGSLSATPMATMQRTLAGRFYNHVTLFRVMFDRDAVLCNVIRVQNEAIQRPQQACRRHLIPHHSLQSTLCFLCQSSRLKIDQLKIQKVSIIIYYRANGPHSLINKMLSNMGQLYLENC